MKPGGNPVEQLKSTLAYSRKLVALGRLTAGIAHEVKNPLNAIVIHLELLRTKIRAWAVAPVHEPQPVAAAGVYARPGGAGPAAAGARPGRADARRSHREGDPAPRPGRAGVSQFTRPEDLRLQPVSIGMLFEEIGPVVAPEAQKHRVKVIRECAASVPEVNGDAGMLRQVFLNLAINGCQAMPQGGTLRLTCGPASGGRVEVRVEDTGEGIPPEHLSRIFDLYFTTKAQGTGIGLSLVFRIVQLHDGEIEVQSTPGRGTTFRVLLPRVS